MTTKIFAVLATFSLVSLPGCESKHYDQNPYSQVKTFLESPHALRKMTESKEPRASLDGEFFLFFGAISGNAQVIHGVKFAWDLGDSLYPITSVPLEKVRVRTTQKVENPTVSFFLDDREINKKFNYLTRSRLLVNYETGKRWVENSELRLLYDKDDVPRFLNEHQGYLKYVVITCNEFDWPQNISLPLNYSDK